MKTVTEYAKDMMKYKDSPDALVKLKIECAQNLVTLLDTQYKPVKLQKAVFWNMKDNYCNVTEDGKVEVLEKREKPLSDTMVESMWNITPGGDKEIRLDITMKGYKIIIDAITTAITWEQSSAKIQRG